MRESLLIFTIVHQLNCIMKPLRTSSGNCTIRENSLKRLPNNILISKRINFWRTDIFKGRVLNVDMKKHMAINCENCGSTLSPTDLINPISTLSGSTPVLKETTHWYLPLDKHESWLRTWITEGKFDGEQHHYPEELEKPCFGAM